MLLRDEIHRDDEEGHTDNVADIEGGAKSARPAIIGFLVLAVVPSVLLAAVVVAPEFDLPRLLGLLLVLFCLTRCVHIATHRGGGPVAIGFYLFVALWFAFPSLLQMSTGRFPWVDYVNTDYFASSEALALAAVIAHSIGWTAARRSRWRWGSKSGLQVWRAAVITVVVGVPGLMASGSLSARFASRSEFVTASEAGGVGGGASANAAIGLLQILPSAAAIVFACAAVLNFRAANKRSLLNYVWLLASALSVALFDNPFSSTRYVALSSIVAIALCIIPLRTTKRCVSFIIVVTLGLLLVYPLAASFKSASAAEERNTGAEVYSGVDFDGFQQSINTEYFIDIHGHSSGRYSLAAVLFFIPREVWPTKALPSSLDVTESRNYHFRNLSMPLWMDLYLDFSLFGIVIGLGCLGFVARILDRAQSSAGGGQLAQLAAVVLAGVQSGFVRGPLGAQFPFVGAALVVVFICAYGRQSRE